MFYFQNQPLNYIIIISSILAILITLLKIEKLRIFELTPLYWKKYRSIHLGIFIIILITKSPIFIIMKSILLIYVSIIIIFSIKKYLNKKFLIITALTVKSKTKTYIPIQQAGEWYDPKFITTPENLKKINTNPSDVAFIDVTNRRESENFARAAIESTERKGIILTDEEKEKLFKIQCQKYENEANELLTAKLPSGTYILQPGQSALKEFELFPREWNPLHFKSIQLSKFQTEKIITSSAVTPNIATSPNEIKENQIKNIIPFSEKKEFISELPYGEATTIGIIIFILCLCFRIVYYHDVNYKVQNLMTSITKEFDLSILGMSISLAMIFHLIPITLTILIACLSIFIIYTVGVIFMLLTSLASFYIFSFKNNA